MRVNYSKLTKPELEKLLENANFTAEEEQIFRFLFRGYSKKEISMKMCLSLRTVERRVREIKKKTGGDVGGRNIRQ